MPSTYLDRLLRAAMKRRCLDTLALHALLKATHLLGLALAERLRQYRHSPDPVLSRFSELQEQALHVALLGEEVAILGSRWDKIPERQRPHYTPQARFRILRLRTLLALSAEETARVFRISVPTVLRWEHEARTEPARSTVGSLLRPTPPVRRYADLVRQLVHSLCLAGFPGDRSVAQVLARAGWRMSRRSVQRIREERLPAPPPKAVMTQARRAVCARYPHHVWMLDITEIPGLLRLFSFKLAVVFDVFSRVPLQARVFLREPSGPDMSRLLKRAARRFGPPRHSVSDRGAQFTSRIFRRMAAHLGVRHRYGAIGRTGSIALIERFFRTLKEIGGFRDRRSLLLGDLERRLAVALDYYIRRPHQGLGGAVPGERLRGLRPAHLESIPPPRGRPGERISDVPMFEIRYADPEQRLPYLVRKAA